MIVKIPPTTALLFEEIEKAVSKLPQRERNAFVLDLMKFVVDWQFALLAMKDADNAEN